MSIASSWGWYYVNFWIPLFAIHRRGRNNLLLESTAFGICVKINKYNFLIRNSLANEGLDYSISFFSPVLKYLRSVILDGIKPKQARIYFLKPMVYNDFFLETKW